MDERVTRRSFSKTMALGIGAAMLPPLQAQAPKVRKLQIGHTGITWMDFTGGRARGARGGATQPPAGGQAGIPAGVASGPPVNIEEIETIVRDVSSLGYYGVELFGNGVLGMENYGGLGKLLEKYNNLPLIAIVASPSINDRLKESVKSMVDQGTVAKKYGCRIALMNASGGRRDENYNFVENKAKIANALNEASKAMADIGIQAVLHQHTGTMVEKRDEVYAILDAVDTRIVKAGFDVGQLAKGGADPVQIVKDFLPIIEHLHLKDWNGGEHYVGYCPLGQGKVDLPKILDMVESKGSLKGMVMVELDPSPGMPIPALETAKIAKAYLEKQGYKFRT
jgi:inosose dehydratase